MANQKTFKISADTLAGVIFNIPWLELMVDIWKLSRKLWNGMADEGMYEVLNYESTLELLDAHGHQARFEKQERVRYLQNNIIAYQDQAWGDGEILVDYQCSPGTVVDQYRPGRKTYLLLSLREMKERGDVDDFHITWKLKNAFLRKREQWDTEVRHRTKRMRIQVIFPDSRPPKRVWLIEYMRRRTRPMPPENVKQLPDNRWLVKWETEKPRLHEEYSLTWEW